MVVESVEPRRSRRARKRPESIYDLARTELEAGLAGEHDDAQQEEDDDFEAEMQTTDPAPKTKKRRRKAAASESVVTKNLWEACGRKRCVEKSALELMEEFESCPATALARVVQFVLECSGATDVSIVGDSIEPGEIGKRQWQAWFSSLAEQLRTRPGNRTQQATLPPHYALLWRSMATACGGQTAALTTCADVLATASSAEVANARQAATVGAMALGAAAAEMAKMTAEKLATAQRQMESAVSGSSKREAIEAQATARRTELKRLEGVIAKLTRAVVAQRYRDARPNVRAACASGLADWMAARPEALVTPDLAKYFGWMLSFREASDRVSACEGLSCALDVAAKEHLHTIADLVAEIAPRLASVARRDINGEARLAAARALRLAATLAEAWDDETVDAVSRDVCAIVVDAAADKQARRDALGVAILLEAPFGIDNSPSVLLYELARFVEGRVLASKSEISNSDIGLIADAFLLIDNKHYGNVLADWSAYAELLLRDDIDVGSRRRPVAVLVGLLAWMSSQDERGEASLDSLLPSLPTFLRKFALGEAIEIAGPLFLVAQKVICSSNGPEASFKDVVGLLVRCLEQSADAAVIQAAAQALSALHENQGTISRHASLDDAIRDAVDKIVTSISTADDNIAIRGAITRLARATTSDGGLDIVRYIPDPRRRCQLANRLVDHVEVAYDTALDADTEADEGELATEAVVDALLILAELTKARTRRALLEDWIDTVADDAQFTRCLPRALISVLEATRDASAADAFSPTQWRFVHSMQACASTVASDVIAACDRRFAFYKGLEYLALTDDEGARLAKLVIEFCRSHTLGGEDTRDSQASVQGARAVGLARPTALQHDDIDAASAAALVRWRELIFQPLLKVAIVDCRRARRFGTSEHDDDDGGVGAAGTLLACAALADDAETLRDACGRLNAVHDLEVGAPNDVLAIAEVHVEAWRIFISHTKEDSAADERNLGLPEFANMLAAASGLDKNHIALAEVLRIGVQYGLEALPDSANLLPAAEPYVTRLAMISKKTKGAEPVHIDLGTLLNDIRTARQHAGYVEVDTTLRDLEKCIGRIAGAQQLPGSHLNRRVAAKPLKENSYQQYTDAEYPSRKQPSIDHNSLDDSDDDAPPIRDVSNVIARTSKRSRQDSHSSAGSKKSRGSVVLEKIDEAHDEDADQEPQATGMNRRASLPGEDTDVLEQADESAELMDAAVPCASPIRKGKPTSRRLRRWSLQRGRSDSCPKSIAELEDADSPAPASRRSLRLSDASYGAAPNNNVLSDDEDEPFPEPRIRLMELAD